MDCVVYECRLFLKYTKRHRGRCLENFPLNRQVPHRPRSVRVMNLTDCVGLQVFLFFRFVEHLA